MSLPVAPTADADQVARLRATDPVAAGILDGHRTFAGPEHVVVDLTNRCNFACNVCWTFSPHLDAAHKPPKSWYAQQLDGAAAQGLLDDLADLGTRIVRFTGGGEPLMHPDAFELLEHGAARGLRMDVTTNASFLDRDRCERLVRAGIGELSVSLWAADEASFLATHPRQQPGTFGRIERTLRYLAGIRRDRLELVLLNVISAANCDRVEAMFDLALDIGADRVYFTLVDPIEGATDALLLDDAQRAAVLVQAERIEARLAALPPGRIGIDFFDGFLARLRADGAAGGEYDAEAVDRIPCYIGWYFCRVTASGDVAPCCRGVDLPMGNLATARFRDIWEGPRYAEFRRKALTLPKRDPYFAPIGCQKMCDNLMHNRMLDERVRQLLAAER